MEQPNKAILWAILELKLSRLMDLECKVLELTEFHNP